MHLSDTLHKYCEVSLRYSKNCQTQFQDETDNFRRRDWSSRKQVSEGSGILPTPDEFSRLHPMRNGNDMTIVVKHVGSIPRMTKRVIVPWPCVRRVQMPAKHGGVQARKPDRAIHDEGDLLRAGDCPLVVAAPNGIH